MGNSKYVFEFFVRVWSLGKAINWLGNQPIVGRLVKPFFSQDGNEAIIIPVQKAVRAGDSAVLPYALIAPLVEQASTRVIMRECMCRRGEGCQEYPHHIGCLFLGEGASQIDPVLGRHVGVSGAMAHVRQAMNLGLIPLIAHNSFDAYVLGIPYRRMLAVCFCCECCCAIRQGLRLGPPAFWDTVVRLPGLSVTVGQACIGCAECLDVCHVQAIVVKNGQASINGQCKGCGRCITVCPRGAIGVHLADDAEILNNLFDRIEQRTDIGLAR